MAREINRLNAKSVATLKKFGRHADGGGLYLSISPNGGRRWTFLYRWRGKPTEIGFGAAISQPKSGSPPPPGVPLARARELAGEARALLAEGLNPKDARRPKDGASFGECADRLIEAMRPSWRNEKHAAQWQMTVMGRVAEADKASKTGWRAAEADYCATIRPLPANKITTDDVLEVLRPIWQAKPETALRLRGRIERVLDAAKAQGLRSGENPARWRGHLDQLLPKRQRLARAHHAAMAYADVPGFMVDLRARETVGARALEFCILTAARTGEVLRARWEEINFIGSFGSSIVGELPRGDEMEQFDRGVWTVPPQRMKAGREHRVPLSGRAMEIVRAMHEVRTSEYVFPGQIANRPLSAAAFVVLRAMKVEGATPHGFRSSFRDWAAECTNFSNEVCEAALAHAISNKAEAAYRRGDVLEKRRLLMEAWATFCSTLPAGKIVQFAQR
jgi:integrase